MRSEEPVVESEPVITHIITPEGVQYESPMAWLVAANTAQFQVTQGQKVIVGFTADGNIFMFGCPTQADEQAVQAYAQRFGEIHGVPYPYEFGYNPLYFTSNDCSVAHDHFNESVDFGRFPTVPNLFIKGALPYYYQAQKLDDDENPSATAMDISPTLKQHFMAAVFELAWRIRKNPYNLPLAAVRNQLEIVCQPGSGLNFREMCDYYGATINLLNASKDEEILEHFNTLAHEAKGHSSKPMQALGLAMMALALFLNPLALEESVVGSMPVITHIMTSRGVEELPMACLVPINIDLLKVEPNQQIVIGFAGSNNIFMFACPEETSQIDIDQKLAAIGNAKFLPPEDAYPMLGYRYNEAGEPVEFDFDDAFIQQCTQTNIDAVKWDKGYSLMSRTLQLQMQSADADDNAPLSTNMDISRRLRGHLMQEVIVLNDLERTHPDLPLTALRKQLEIVCQPGSGLSAQQIFNYYFATVDLFNPQGKTEQLALEDFKALAVRAKGHSSKPMQALGAAMMVLALFLNPLTLGAGTALFAVGLVVLVYGCLRTGLSRAMGDLASAKEKEEAAFSDVFGCR